MSGNRHDSFSIELMSLIERLYRGVFLVNRHLVPQGYLGITLWPFVIMKSQGSSPRDIRHERIHLRQQLEMGVLPFYLWYGLEYLIRRLQYESHYEAYCNISFEREAYSMDGEMGYLNHRSFWAWTRFLKK